MRSLITLVIILTLAACGGGRDGEDPAGWCDPGDECPVIVDFEGRQYSESGGQG